MDTKDRDKEIRKFCIEQAVKLKMHLYHTSDDTAVKPVVGIAKSFEEFISRE